MERLSENTKAYLRSLGERRVSVKYRIELYKDINTTPILNAQRAEEGDYKLLIKSGKEYYNSILDDIIKSKISELNCQLLDEFGVSVEYMMLFLKRNEIINLELKLLEGDRSAETFLMIAKEHEKQILSKLNTEEVSIKKINASARLLFLKEFHVLEGVTMYDFHYAIREIISSVRQDYEEKQNYG